MNSGESTPGEVVSQSSYVETIEGRAYSFEDELARHRQDNFFPRADARARRAPSFKTRTLRRG